MHAATDQSPVAEPARPLLRLLPGTRPRATPRIVAAGGLTSEVHFLAGPAVPPGQVFVLLHGIGMSHRYYRRLQALLSRHGATYAVDLPGFGGTPTPARQLSVADYAAHTAAVLEKMGVARAVVVGHSMGTQFATELAVQRPDLVSHVALLGPVVDPSRRTVLQQSLALGMDCLKESPLANAVVFTDYARSGLRWYLTELPVMMDYNLDARLAMVSQPVTVIRGSRDPIAPRDWCEKLAATAPNGRFLEIPGKPHLVQHGGAAGTAAEILRLAGE